MNESLELVKIVYKTAKMGVYTTKKLTEMLKTKENKIKHVLEEALKEYEKHMNESKKILKKNKVALEKNSLMSKMGSEMGIKMETKKDNSDSAIAQMIIEGMTMGVVEMEAKISNYRKVVEKEVLELAENFLEFQENEIEKLKTFM